MFYCNKCAKEKGWHESLNKSFGKCEICNNVLDCNDVQSRDLPLPRNKN